jgi:Na+/H+ antiporter NhaD/arsenite permease-like protein
MREGEPIRCWMRPCLLLVLLVAGGSAAPARAAQSENAGASDTLVVSGTVTNPQGKGVGEVVVHFLANGVPLELAGGVTTEANGGYEAKLQLPAGTLPDTRLEVQVAHPSYRTSRRIPLEHVFLEKVDSDGTRHYIAHCSVSLKRSVSPALWIAAAVLIAVYLLIAFELMHRTLAAMVGASVLLFVSYSLGSLDPSYRILTFDDAMRAIDDNVIFLLMGMMILVGVLKRTGVFQWMAYKSFQLTRGNIYGLVVLLMFVTAVISALLDNVTTVLLIIPVTIEIALALKIDPVSLLLPQVFASNVGGTSTLIGDPPNVMIGSYAGLTFMDFVAHVALVCLIGLAIVSLYFAFWFRKDYRSAKVEDVPAMTARLREQYRITDSRLLAKAGLVLALTILLFVLHGTLNMEPSIAAMAGASLLLVVSGVHVVEMVEKEVEWPTLIFFMMLFIVVAGAEQTGLIQIVANWVREAAQGSPVTAVLMVLWVSAVLSAIIDNIPFTATMLPVVAYLTNSIPGIHGAVLWWALCLGACLGGNATLIGASANVVTAGLAEKAGHPVSFTRYLRVAAVPTLLTVVLSTCWLLAADF